MTGTHHHAQLFTGWELALGHDPPNLHLPNIWDYMCVPLHPDSFLSLKIMAWTPPLSIMFAKGFWWLSPIRLKLKKVPSGLGCSSVAQRLPSVPSLWRTF
jgi:hypothetical protein